MRVLFTSLRNTSHFLPLVPFIEACKTRGHEVAVAAPQDLAERVAKTGVPFMPFDHPGDAGLAPIWARLRSLSPEESKRVVIGEIFAGVTAASALPGLMTTLETWKPNVIVRESQEYAAVVAGEKMKIPCARISITLSGGEKEIYALAASNVDQHREKLGLPPEPSGERMFQSPSLTLLPESLEYPNTAAPGIKRFRVNRPAAKALPDWWNGSEQPLVYITLGTVAGGMPMAHAAYKTALTAVADLPVRVLLTIGSELPLEALGEVPSNVHVERFVPQDDVLPAAAAVLCHGGSGSVLGALAAGVPMVVTPMFADQPQNAERIAATGAGVCLDGKTLAAPELRAAISRVLEDGSFRAGARRFAQEIAALPDMDAAAAELERVASAG